MKRFELILGFFQNQEKAHCVHFRTGVTRTTATGTNGRYEFPNLPVGNYEVSASMQGFQTTIRSGLELTVGRNAIVNLALQVGEVSQAITVTGEARLLGATIATVSSLVQEEQVLRCR